MSLLAASNSKHRSEEEFVALVNGVSIPVGTSSLRAHHAYTLCTSQKSPSFAPEVQNCLVRFSKKHSFSFKLKSNNAPAGILLRRQNSSAIDSNDKRWRIYSVEWVDLSTGPKGPGARRGPLAGENLSGAVVVMCQY